MRSIHSFAINFITRHCKENKKKALIYAHIIVDTERKEISLKEQIDTDAWKTKEEKVKGKSIEIKSLNEYINDVLYRIKEKYRMLQDTGAIITAESVKAVYLGVHTSQKRYKLLELTAYYKEIWKLKLKWGTFKNYLSNIDYLILFVKRQFPAGGIYLSQLNMQFATDFEHYVRNNPIKAHDPCKGNGLGKPIQRFKRMVEWSVEIE